MDLTGHCRIFDSVVDSDLGIFGQVGSGIIVSDPTFLTRKSVQFLQILLQNSQIRLSIMYT
jgi:hypothetical protein